MSAEPEIIEYESREIALRPPAEVDQWVPRFAITVDEAVGLVDQKREFMRRVMREGEHYGAIPGTGEKKTLLKPGAELLLSSMGLHPRYRDTSAAIEDWTGADHGGEPFFRYRKTCMITRQIGPGPDDYVVIAEAGGNCNSWEEKYRWRDSSLVCPECGKPTVIKGKVEYGGGWICFKKKGGCGAKFADKAQAITSQVVGKVPNPNIADLANTLEKMADKRALIAATLLATGCSDIFTQDVGDAEEDFSPPFHDDEPAAGGQRGAQPTAAATPPRGEASKEASVTPASAAAADPVPVTELYKEALELATTLWLRENPSDSKADAEAGALARLDKAVQDKWGVALDKLNHTNLEKVVLSYRVKVSAEI